MRGLMPLAPRRLIRLVLLCLIVAGGLSGVAGFMSAQAAMAIACGTAIAAGTPCTLTGTATISAGSLTLTAPSSLTWAGTLNGYDEQLADTADTSYQVNDATGSGSGWHVTASATTFTTGTVTLANSGTLSINGSTSSETASTAPSASCNITAGSNTCTLPTNGTSYPVAITTAASSPTAATIYDTSGSTGMGSILIGGTPHPVGWWVSVPSSTPYGTYTSTITLEVISGP